jgi:ribosomal protein L37E
MTDTIAECDLCGRVDHHLRAGVCAACLALHADDMHDYELLPALDSEAALLGRAIVSEEEIAAEPHAEPERPFVRCTRCREIVHEYDHRNGLCRWCGWDLRIIEQQAGGKPT